MLWISSWRTCSKFFTGRIYSTPQVGPPLRILKKIIIERRGSSSSKDLSSGGSNFASSRNPEKDLHKEEAQHVSIIAAIVI